MNLTSKATIEKKKRRTDVKQKVYPTELVILCPRINSVFGCAGLESIYGQRLEAPTGVCDWRNNTAPYIFRLNQRQQQMACGETKGPQRHLGSPDECALTTEKSMGFCSPWSVPGPGWRGGDTGDIVPSCRVCKSQR